VPTLISAVLEPLGVGIEGAPLSVRVARGKEQSDGDESEERTHGGIG
jgi:hypothetical protein